MVRQATHRDPASTKSAPQRSGDSEGGRLTLVRAASTKSAPQRSGDPCWRGLRGPPSGLNEVRSPKERRPRTRKRSHAPPLSLNEVRSPKERRRRSGRNPDQWASPQRSPLPKGAETPRMTAEVAFVVPPQRSPLPKGAETTASAWQWTPPSNLNEVRSPKERSEAPRVSWRLGYLEPAPRGTCSPT